DEPLRLVPEPMSRISIILLCLFTIFLFACGLGESNTPSTQSFASPSDTLERAPVRTSLLDGTPAPPPQVTGKYIFAPGDGSIWVQDPANGQPQPVIKPSPELFADSPNFSPDGKSFVYIHSSLTEQRTAENTVYQHTQDGTQYKPVAVPPSPKTSYNWPHYSWDGKWIYYTASYPVPPNKQHSEIQRIPVGGGKPQTVIDDARMSTESPDARRIAFIRFNFETFTGSLWIADIDGKNAKMILSDDVFIMIAAPQFS